MLPDDERPARQVAKGRPGPVQVAMREDPDLGPAHPAPVDAARVVHAGSATPTGLPADGVGTVTVESGIADAAVAKLESLGHRVTRGKSGGGYQGILIDWENDVLHGATESRKDGAAVGY